MYDRTHDDSDMFIRAGRHVVEADQVNVVAAAVLRDLEEIRDAREARRLRDLALPRASAGPHEC